MSDRYKDTKFYDDGDGRYTQGPWQLPPEFEKIDDSWDVHIVRQHEVGFFDTIAVRYFGDGMESFWWIIAHVNGIMNIENDVKPGDKIRIPPRQLVESFISRASNAANRA